MRSFRSEPPVVRAGVPYAKSVPESDLFILLGLAESEKQIPRFLKTQKSKSK